MGSTANKKMKRFTALKGVIDGLRSSVTTPPKAEVEITETLRSDHLKVCKTVRHGFPFQPTAVAFDPVQHILAIGTKTGSLRIIGRPGVDCHCVHDTDVAIIQILFLVNEGALVTVCSDDSLHLWNFRQKRPEIVHTLKFQRERITYCHLPFQSKWLYIGTERGNVHIVNIESFVLSGYVINWNKAIELSRKTHPGPVVHLSDNPLDPTKLLIGFESGAIVLWDLRSKAAEFRSSSPEALRSIAWHHEGRQFMCSHSDGSLTTWSCKSPGKPINVMMPHAKIGKDGKPDPCKPITKVDWKSVRSGEPLVIFSGGMSYDRAGRTPSITVMNGKTTTVLEMEHNVVDFVVLCESPWSNDFQDPYAIVVLLQNDLVVVDLTTPGYPCFENPYPMDIHESPVTACQYYADCPPDLVPAFYSVGSKQKKTGFTDKSWPVNGGEWGTTTCSYPEIIITGHADGSVKFWDASAVTLQVLYKFKTAKIFEKPKKSVESQQGQQQDDDPFAIQMIELCPESRVLCVAGLTHVIHFRFSKQENTVDLPVLEVSIMYEIADELDSPEFEYPCPQRSMGLQAQHSGSMGSYSSNTSDNGKESVTSVRVKSGQRKWSPGYQPDLVCLLTHIDGEPPSSISSMSFNTHYGLLAFGNECGLAIIDCMQKTCLLNLGTPDLYGSMDPYQRAPRSPHLRKQQLEQPTVSSEENKSPTTEQPPSATSPASASPSSSSNPVAPPRAKRKSSATLQGLTPITEVKGSPSTSQPSTPEHEVTSTSAETKASKEESKSRKDVMAHSRSEPTSPLDSDQAVLPPIKSSSTGSLHLVGREGREPLQPDPSQVAPVDRTEPEPTPKAEVPAKSKPKRPPLPKKVVEKTKSDSSTGPDTTDTDEVDRCKRATSDPDLSKSKSTAFSHALGSDPLVFPGDKSAAPAHPQSASEEVSEHKTSLMGKMRRKSKSKTHRKASNGDGKSEGETGEAADVTEGKGGEETKESNNNVVSSQTVTHPPGPGKGKDHGEGTEGHHGKSFLRKMSVKLFGPAKPKEEEEKEKEKPRNPRDIKVDIIDVTDENAKKPVIRRLSVVEISQGKHIDKNDGNSFSRSRSSSMSSLDNVSKEAIQCLVFADSYTKKTDNCTCPCLWVGTSLGSVIVVMLNFPPNSERNEKPVFVSPSGTIFRLRGAILTMSFLDCNGMLIPFQTEVWKDAGKEDRRLKQQMSVSGKPRISPTSSTEICDRQFAIICSEKQARVMSLPSQTCAYKVRITEASFVVRAQVVSIRDTVCLMCYVANGHIMGFSLPSLKLLLETAFLPLTDFRIVRTFCFSNNGHAMYLCSPSEVQKLTYSSDICDNLNEMLGDLFMPCDTPEAPKQGFFKNLFSGAVSTFNREELFGEASGKASKGLAKHIPGTGGMSQLQAQSGAIGGEVARTRQLFVERGERLGELDDKTAQMMTQAENFAQAAHQIMLKYKDKKWYQF